MIEKKYTYTEEELKNSGIADLKKLAREYGIPNVSSKKKAELIPLILDAQEYRTDLEDEFDEALDLDLETASSFEELEPTDEELGIDTEIVSDDKGNSYEVDKETGEVLNKNQLNGKHYSKESYTADIKKTNKKPEGKHFKQEENHKDKNKSKQNNKPKENNKSKQENKPNVVETKKENPKLEEPKKVEQTNLFKEIEPLPTEEPKKEEPVVEKTPEDIEKARREATRQYRKDNGLPEEAVSENKPKKIDSPIVNKIAFVVLPILLVMSIYFLIQLIVSGISYMVWGSQAQITDAIPLKIIIVVIAGVIFNFSAKRGILEEVLNKYHKLFIDKLNGGHDEKE